MTKKAADDFYIKICIWTFLCLILAAAFHEIKTVVTSRFERQNEVTAARWMVRLGQLQSEYAAEHGGKFAPNFDELVRERSLDDSFRGQYPVIDGYTFAMKVEEATQTKPAFYSINADAHVPSGDEAPTTRHFYFDSTHGTIKHTEENRPAEATDPAI